MADAAILASNFALGLFAFFAPCGFPMLPAYVAYYLPRSGDGAPSSLARDLARGVGGGMLAALGAFLVLLLIGGLALALGSPFKQRVVWLELVGGLVVITLGTLMILGRGPSVKIAMRPSQRRSALSLVGFGALYAMTASSCVAPILLGVLVPALSAPSLASGLIEIGAYAAGMSMLLLVASVLIATSQERIMRASRRILPHVERVSGVLLIAVGLYLIWYWGASELGWVPPPTVPAP